MWEKAIKPEHFKSGFRASGLFSLSEEAISKFKLATSIPYQDEQPSEAAASKVTSEVSAIATVKTTGPGTASCSVKVTKVNLLTCEGRKK